MTSSGTALDWNATTAPATEWTPVRQSSRVQWLDVAKGLGILLVVAGHAIGGMIDSPAGAKLPYLRPVFLAIYIFHMPLMFFLSGLLVQARIARGRTGFFLGMLATIAYPYFLWSTVQYSAIYAAGSLVNRPVELFWRPILNLPLSSISQFWYLYVLFLMHLAALLLIPRIGSRMFFGIALVVKLSVLFLAFPVMIRLTFLNGAYYAAGIVVGVAGLERLRGWVDRHRSGAMLFIMLGAAAVGTATIAIMHHYAATLGGLKTFETSVIAWRLPYLPAALLGTGAAIMLAMLQRGKVADMVAYLGQRSMAIFVLHVLFISGARILLSRFLHLPPGAVLGLCMIIGLLMPLVIYEVATRFTRSRFLGLG